MTHVKTDSHQQMVRVFIGLGSNLDGPAAQIATALKAIASLPTSKNLESSSFYRNPPMGPADQPDYVNAVVGLDTSLQPIGLLDSLQQIELAQGRVRSGPHWGPRIIDLDVLLYGDLKLDSKRLKLPHPGLCERVFVLSPLHEIAPALVLPGGQRLADLIRGVDTASLQRIDG